MRAIWARTFLELCLGVEGFEAPMAIHLIKGELLLNGSDAKRRAPGMPTSGPWVEQTARHLGLEAALRSRGRPPKKGSSQGHATSRDNNVAP